MNLRYGTTDVAMPMPKWGYECKISLPLIIEKLSSGNGYAIWDNGANGANYDIRTLKCEWFLSLTDTNTLIDLFRNSAKGRAGNITIKLGVSASGFFPFGPDKGDAGDFVTRLISIDPKPSIGHPADYFNVECEFVHVGSYPVYVIPDANIDGSLQIGTINQLRYPQPMHDQKISYGVHTVITHNASAYANDSTSTADEYEAIMNMGQTQANAARLIYHLCKTVRASTVDIIPPANSYLFGRENASTATYTCQWPQNEISITNPQFGQFDFSLNFYRVSQA